MGSDDFFFLNFGPEGESNFVLTDGALEVCAKNGWELGDHITY